MPDDSDEFAFRVLGPVQVTAAAGPVRLARRQQLDLLALLILRADHVMPVEHIVDAMWGEHAPATARTQIKNMVSALRAALVDRSQPLATVDWQPAGYRLRLHRGVDLAAFTGLVAQAHAAPPDDAARLLRRAVGLWRGPHALAGVRADFAGAARTHLDEQRSAAFEALFAAELEIGHHGKIIVELTEAVAQHPTRERLVAQLMTALHRSGRTSDALGAYRRARRIFAEEYGLEPGRLLRDLERQLLLGDPVLAMPRTDPLRPRSAVPVPAQLPADIRGFAGRASELAQLDALVDGLEQPRTVVISALMGSAGVGKTSLAVHWAHRVAHRFPDGQLHVNLRGFESDAAPMSPAEAVRGFLDAFAIPPERIPTGLNAQAALYRSLVAGRRMLVVLDNAVSAEQVRPLLPGAAGCLVLVTSRNRLTGLVAFEGAHPVTLDVLTAAEARELLVARLGAARVSAEERAVQCLAARCARLPLALAMVAARAAIHPGLPLGALATQLTETSVLSALAGKDTGVDVRAVFSWSYARLGPDAARLFRWLGHNHGPDIAIAAAASLVGEPVEIVRGLLTELTNTHLVAEHGPDRFAMHDLLRAYAAELCAALDPAPVRAAAVRRLLDHYLHTADRAAGQLYPHRYQLRLRPADPNVTIEAIADREQALAWFTGQRRILIEAVEQAAATDLGSHTWQLATTIGIFVDRQGHWGDWISALQTALATAERLADPFGRAHAHSGLGLARCRMRQFQTAHDHLARAVDLFADLDDYLGQAYAQLRMSSACEGLGRLTEALTHTQRARELYDAAGHHAGQAQALNTIGWYHAQLGNHREAINHCEHAVALHRKLGDRQGTAHTLDSLGYIHQQLGDFDRAASYYRESAQILQETGDRSHAAFALTHLGDAHSATGDLDRARDAWGEALRIFDELGHPDVDRVTTKLRHLGPARQPAAPAGRG